MRHTAITLLAGALLCFSTTSMAEDIPITPSHWELNGNGAEIVNHDGRTALKLNRGSATLKDIEFSNGVIEFDVWMQEERGFGGVYFRADGVNAENFYFRPHLNRKPDGTQYMPVNNSNGSWQIFHGDRYSFTPEYQFGEWMPVKLAINGDKMDIYMGGDEPALHVEDLLLDKSSGQISFSGARTDFYFSNIRVTTTDAVELKGSAKPKKDLAAGQFTSFQVASKPVNTKEVEAKATLNPALLANQTWVQLAVTETGAANLSEILSLSDEADTALVRMTFTAEQAQLLPLKYGFSDRVTVFANGTAIAHENDTYMTRDYRYLGTVGLFDTVFLPLKAGQNEIVFAVSEGFGGWAFLAAAELPPGVKAQ